MASGDGLYKTDHPYSKHENDRTPGFQLILDRNGPDHSYSMAPEKPKKRKRIDLTPTGMSPEQSKIMLDETVRRMNWNEEEKNMLASFSKEERVVGETETSFWKRCANKLNEKFQDKKRTGHSCKSACRRLSLGSDDTSDATLSKDASTQTEWSIPIVKQSECGPQDGEWLFMEPKKEIKSTVNGTSLLHEAALKRLRRCSELKSADRVSLIESLLFSSVKEISNKIMSSPLRGEIILTMLSDIEHQSAECCNKRNILSNKTFTNLVNFQWGDIIKSMVLKQPFLAEVLLAVALPTSKIGCAKATESALPVLGSVYGMLMKQRYHELSLVQKVVAVTLANEQTNQKVYDRLQPLGITLSHSGMLKTMDHISGFFNAELIDALKNGKSFRIVGDNINYQVGVSHARQSSGKVSHIENWFGSAAIIQNIKFDHLSSVSPQCDLRTLPVSTFIINEQDWKNLTSDMSRLFERILTEFFPWLSFAHKVVHKDILGEYSNLLIKKNKVIPLPVMAKNEQKYTDVVDILDDYENQVQYVYENAGIPVDKIHIGGDQLTRERFSGAKRLRAAAMSSSEMFDHLKPITFELFHLQMTVLTTFFQILYDTSCTEPFSLHSQKIRLMRKDADGHDIKNHYNHCKELAISFIKAYVVEFACHHFDVDNTDTIPSCIDLPESSNMSDLEILDWLNQLVSPMVEDILKDSKNFISSNSELIENQTDKGDMIEDYGRVVLELGLIVLELNDIIQVPDRQRILSLMKYLMLFLKAHNNRSKYALEILRLLCQQYSLLSEIDANKSMYGLFVNTGNRVNTHIPADLQMEYLVRLTKGHLKSMCSNVSEQTMKKRSSAFYGLQEVADNFDVQTNVIKRAQKHRIPSSYEDEKLMINDLRSIRPFTRMPGRQIDNVKKAPKNTMKKLKLEEIETWIENHKFNFYYELGQ